MEEPLSAIIPLGLQQSPHDKLLETRNSPSAADMHDQKIIIICAGE